MPDFESSLDPPASIPVELDTPGGTFVLTYDNLDSGTIIQSVQDDTAGAIAVFIGTTRNSFQGESLKPFFCPSHSRVDSF
jgi:molybdopterin synthase catalytic subunit